MNTFFRRIKGAMARLYRPATNSNVGELLRTLGFAAAPGIFRAVPALARPVFALTTVWMLAEYRLRCGLNGCLRGASRRPRRRAHACHRTIEGRSGALRPKAPKGMMAINNIGGNDRG